MYVKTKLLVSRAFAKEPTGVSIKGLIFYRSMEEYDSADFSFLGSYASWTSKPQEFEVLLEFKDLEGFLTKKEALLDHQVHFQGSDANRLYLLGRDSLKAA